MSGHSTFLLKYEWPAEFSLVVDFLLTQKTEILEKKEKPKVSNADPKKLHDVKVELKRIGTNLNQLTRLANSGKINNKELIRLLEDVKESNLQTQEVLCCVVRGNKRGR